MTAKHRMVPADWKTSCGFWEAACEYAIDAAQRQVLFRDTMRRRGNRYREQTAKTALYASRRARRWTNGSRF